MIRAPLFLAQTVQITMPPPPPQLSCNQKYVVCSLGMTTPHLCFADSLSEKWDKLTSPHPDIYSAEGCITHPNVLVGVSEAFVYVAQIEFFATQTPDGLKSLGIGLSMASSAIGSYAASMILTVVMEITTKDGRPGWVPPNLNDGHLDRFFFLSAALTALNLALYIVCAKRYKFISLEKREGER